MSKKLKNSLITLSLDGKMKIVDVKATPVVVPFEAPVRWSFGVRTGTTRTIVKVFTDEGITGLGETYGGRPTALGIENLKHLVIGEDPFNVERIVSKFFGFGARGMLPVGHPIFFSALEIACWDIMGKALNTPVYNLIGGKTREKISTAGFVYYRYKSSAGVGGESTSEDIVKYCSNLVEEYGFETLKLKLGVFNPRIEIKAVKKIREALGEKIRLRADPNAIWSVGTSIKTLRELGKYDFEYIEDPVPGLWGMAEVRRKVNVPLATNMCVIYFDQIPPAVELGSIDVILSDLFQWGGILNSKKLAAIAETFQLGLGSHDNATLGVSTAATLHFAAAVPYLKYAADHHYHYYVDDIITEPFEYEDGCMTVPRGPGLGVELDEEKVDKYNKFLKEMGEARHTFDPRRPDWLPMQPSW